MTEQDEIRYGDSTISYTVVRSARRKRTIALRFDGAGGVLVAAPMAASRAAIREAVLARARWILANAATLILRPQSREFLNGETTPYLGQEIRMNLEIADLPGVRIVFHGTTLGILVPPGLASDARPAAIRTALLSWYRSRAEEAVGEAVRRWSAIMGLAPARFLVRDQKRRWGSCSSDRKLRFNWRLSMVEPGLLDYVVVHELAHLVERNHSKAFWAVVERFMPDCQIRRRRLRESEASVGIG